jgi:putative ABC transport system permease protein
MSLLQDIRYGTRVLLKRPGFAIAVVLTLALGIGVTTSIFSIVNAALLRPLPYSGAEKLMLVWEWDQNRNKDQNLVSPFNFLFWKEQSTSFKDLAAVDDRSATLTGVGSPVWLRMGEASSGFFRTLAVTPVLGRAFSPEEERPGGGHVVLLGHGLWQSHFGGDRGVLGKSLMIDGESRVVVGVLPPGFKFLSDADLWEPLTIDPASPGRGRSLTVVGRLAPGVTRERAQQEMNGIAKRLAEREPKYNAGWSVNVIPVREYLVGNTRTMLLMLLGAVVFVLLIACANVANLFLSRATSRQREVAVRVALGAGLRHLFQQLLAESALLAAVSGALGLALAWFGTKLLVRFAPENIPSLDQAGLDWRVLLFALGITAVVAALFGLAPALVLGRPDLRDDLKDGGGKSTSGGHKLRLRNLLVVTDIAMAVVLLIGAGLMLHSLHRLQQVELGFQPENVLTLRISLPNQRYPDQKQWVSFFDQALEKVQALPGVRSAGAVSFLPMAGFGAANPYTVEGEPTPTPGQEPVADLRFVSPGYLDTMKIPILQGRSFTPQDRRDSPFVVIVGQQLARKHWHNESPIGKRIQMQWAELVNGKVSPLQISATVVGVARDIREQGFESEPGDILYWPMRQLPWNPVYMVVRSSADPAALSAGVRQAVESIDPDQPVYAVATMESLLARSIAQRRFSMALLSLFSILALVLASVGIYGVLSYTVSQRTQEIGIRMALGSARTGILRLIVGEGMRLSVLGLAVGLLLAFVLAKLIASLLYQVSLVDPLVYVAVPLLLIGVAFFACYLPARRASRVEPIAALKYE